jgi:hypothetical protein
VRTKAEKLIEANCDRQKKRKLHSSGAIANHDLGVAMFKYELSPQSIHLGASCTKLNLHKCPVGHRSTHHPFFSAANCKRPWALTATLRKDIMTDTYIIVERYEMLLVWQCLHIRICLYIFCALLSFKKSWEHNIIPINSVNVTSACSPCMHNYYHCSRNVTTGTFPSTATCVTDNTVPHILAATIHL